MDQDSPADASPPAGAACVRVRTGGDDPADAVAALYARHALSLIRLAHVMLSDRGAAEDVVQDAFCGLYRRWGHLESTDKALSYLRSSVLNGCRSVLRSSRRTEPGGSGSADPAVVSTEVIALSSEERRAVIQALTLLPEHQREVLVLRFYLDLPDNQIAADLGVRPSTVRSTRRRALLALKRSLKEMR